MGKNLEEMCRLVTGYGAWHIGDIHVSDGPHGVRAQEDGAKNNDSYEATCFPTASSVACSWDTELIGKMAEGIADEARELGVSVILGPGVNIKRSPLCGRNFEYYSEDPFLSGELAAAYILAMQKSGVGTSLKHFAGNNQETHRIEYDEARFHERHDSVISAVRSFSVKLAGGINQGLSALVLIVSGIYAKSQSISALEIEVNRGEISSDSALMEANKYIEEISATQGLVFRLGMVLIPVFALIISYAIIRKTYHIDEAEYEKLVRDK